MSADPYRARRWVRMSRAHRARYDCARGHWHLPGHRPCKGAETTHHVKYHPRGVERLLARMVGEGRAFQLMRRYWPKWLVAPWWLMVLCQGCHATVTGLHRSGMSVAGATRQVLGPVRWWRWRVISTAPVWGLATAVVLALIYM